LFYLSDKFPEFYQFHGRRISRKLSKANLELIQNLYGQYSIDHHVIDLLSKKTYNLDLSLNNKFKKIMIEVGFGNGEHLIFNAKKNQEYLYIGSEVYINGIAKVLKNIKKFDLENIKICGLNFLYLLRSLKFKSINEIYIINPDPWPKKRHNKRRLLNYDTILSMKKVVKKNGRIFVSTDSKDYFDQIKLTISQNRIFDRSIFESMSDLDAMYGISNYQRKAISNNQNIYKIEFICN
tara:strand:+ start:385 stop:1095 length:711 start_codon:yes stop_codon:yes gene_type:complete